MLNPININIKYGESVAIVGASGSGKSTLLGLLAGLDDASEGEIYLDGQPLHSMNEEQRAQLRGGRVGFIFQTFMLVQSLTALENIMLPAQLTGLPNAAEQAKSLLKKVGLDQRANHYPNQLSGGEQQRVAIARAFICKPKILFADEPTGNLDAKNSINIESLLFELNKNFGATLLLVTHDNELAEKCDRQLHIHAGSFIDNINHVEEVIHDV
ncbi:MAG: ABC transporter ATP-binding protein [Alteromonadaceae bacterium]|nr:ABC transporter ATP-binding protein [Alteromonadaceae bacterium]